VAEDISTKVGCLVLLGDPYISIHFEGQGDGYRVRKVKFQLSFKVSISVE